MQPQRVLSFTAIVCSLAMAGCGPRPRPAQANPPPNSYRIDSFHLNEAGASEEIRGAIVTPAFFQAVNVPPYIGRGFFPEDYQPGNQQVVLLTHRFWKQRFASNPAQIGVRLVLNGHPFTVIGIMPPGFETPAGVDIWAPTADL
jgi:putative ABC transport system permease protein